VIKVEIPRGAVQKAIGQEKIALAVRVREGLERATREAILNPLRAHTAAALKGGRIATTWRVALFPDPPNHTLRPSAMIYTMAPHIIRVHDAGAVIVPKSGRKFLAIPTAAVPRQGSERKHLTMAQMEKRAGPWRILAADNGRFVVVGKHHSQVKRLRRRHRLRIEEGEKSFSASKDRTVYFILVPEVRLPKRLNVAGVMAAGRARLPAIIQAKVSYRPSND
jgi:hypothetical protein